MSCFILFDRPVARADISVADLHYSVGKGECKDTDLEPCDGDAETAKWLGEALDAEKPDMVVRQLTIPSLTKRRG